MTDAALFSTIYDRNLWGSEETRSGFGSKHEQTRAVRNYLPSLIQRLNVRSLLDVGCGDLHWLGPLLPELPLQSYHGIDLVADVIADNRAAWGYLPHVKFHVLDVVFDPLPVADLVLVRDCFFHLASAYVLMALANIRRSGIRWGWLSTNPTIINRWRPESGVAAIPIHLADWPFGLKMVELLDEEHFQGGRYMGLFELSHE